MVNFASMPAALKGSCQFCVWKKEKGKDGRLTKIPYNPENGQKAQTNAPQTFAPFRTAAATYAVGGYDGLGIRVDNGIGAFDIDHCIREDGSLNDVATDVLTLFPTAYVERSPSGTGLRGFFRVHEDFVFDKTVYYINNRKLGLEVYMPGATNRFVTVTGDVFRDGEVPDNMEAVMSLLDSKMKRKTQVVNRSFEACSYLSDESVIEHAAKSKNGERFMDYYRGDWQKYFDNQSDADMGFLAMLSFWCGCDEEQMDRIFRNSGMMRPKWDRQQAGTTYGAISIRNAVASCTAIYLPVNAQDMVHEDFAPLDDGDDLSSADDKADHDAKPDTARKKGGVDFEPDYSRVTLTLADMKPHTNPRYGQDEIGMGNAFADFYKPIARFNSSRQVWFVYDGRVWRADTGGLKVAEMAKKLANAMYCFAIEIKEEDTRKRFIDRVRKLQLRKHRETMLKDARSVYPIAMDAFDKDEWLFNCKNGTLDLQSMTFREHRPEDYLTMLSGVTYDPSARCPRWDQFMQEVTIQDDGLVDFIQRALGYSLTADTSQECMFILYGATSRNGKGTTMETFLKILGDYGKTSQPEMIMAKFGNSNSGGPSEDVARLAGARFVNISEPEKKITLNAALVKRLTGNNITTARFLHENSFEYKPAYKIMIDTNYLPNVTDNTLFTSGRLIIIPFKRHFSASEQDKGLKKFLSQPENLSGIFNWCLEGYRKYTERKLEQAQAVMDATAEYEKESDRIGQFAETWLEAGEAYEVRTSAVYRMYQTWCDECGYRAENKTNFNKAIRMLYPIERRRPLDGGDKTTMLMGCRLREDEDLVIPES